MKIFIVDDEPDIRDILSFNILKNGYDVETASSGEEAIELINHYDCDLVLLDIMMSGIDGFITAEKLRKIKPDLPIIFLTALNTEPDLLHGFSIGADDYIAKPFSIKEVIARIKAVLSRSPQNKDLIIFEDIHIDTIKKTVSVNGQLLQLTKTEYMLLNTLIRFPERTFSRNELLSKVWPNDTYVEPRTVDVHIARLRKKLSESSTQIINRSGYGYCLTK